MSWLAFGAVKEGGVGVERVERAVVEGVAGG